MTTVRITTPIGKSTLLTLDKESSEILSIVSTSGFDATARVMGSGPNSPVAISLNATLEEDIEFFKEVLGDNQSINALIPPLETDPLEVSTINNEGSGFVCRKDQEGNYVIIASVFGAEIYKSIVNGDFDPENQVKYLEETGKTLDSIQSFIKQNFGENSAPVFTPAPEKETRPMLANESALFDAIGKLREEVIPSNPRHRNGYFLLTLESNNDIKPLLLKVKGDCERLRDMGYLELIRLRHPNEIKVTPYGRYSLMSLSGEVKRNYMTALRSVLLDAGIAGDYSFESMELTETNDDVNAVFL